MYFIGFLYLPFIGSAYHQKLFNLLYFFLGLIFEGLILILNNCKSILDLINFMALVLFCMFINALHTHDLHLMLTKENQILLMNMALSGETILGWSIFWGFIISLWIITCFADALGDIRGFSFIPNIWKSLRIAHLFKLFFCETRFLRIIRNYLSKCRLIQFWALHVFKKKLVFLRVYQIFDVYCYRIFLTLGTNKSEFLI